MKLERFDKRKKNKNIAIILTLIILVLGGGILLYKSYANFVEVETFNVIKGQVPDFKKSDIELAITIDGEEATNAPTSGDYSVNVSCSDNALGTWDYESWEVTITNLSSKKTKCTINFNSYNTNVSTFITNIAKTDTTSLVLDDETADHNTRYIGSNPDNYLCFDSNCTNGKWRIIGVMNNMATETNGSQNLVKIIRADSLSELAWNKDMDSKASYIGTNEWTNSLIYSYLTGDWYTENLTSYDNLVESVVWKLGGIIGSDEWIPDTLYTEERGENVYEGHETSWTGKIALMYPSDYGYATSGGDTTSRKDCLTSILNWETYTECYLNDYLYDSTTHYWVLSPRSDAYELGINFSTGGLPAFFHIGLPSVYRPSLYLTSDTKILSGKGTSDEPWIVGLEASQTSTYLNDYITTLAKSDRTNLVLDDETVDHNTRYIGADPDNYLCFDKDCTNGKWRAIGVMNNMTNSDGETKSLVKIIRATSIGINKWDSNGANDWTTASLNTYLNGEWYTENLTDYDNLVESVVWSLGASNSYDITTSTFYEYERNANAYSNNPTEWTGKVGLMYPSDYGFATSGGTTTDRTSCLTNELHSWNDSSVSDCRTNDYLYFKYYEWTLTPFSEGAKSVYFVDKDSPGAVHLGYASDSRVVRPVGYLKSNTQILSGEGTSESPWIIGL